MSPGCPPLPPRGDQNNVFANDHQSHFPPFGVQFGLGDSMAPIPDQSDPNKILASIGYNMDRLANPETSAKPGNMDSPKRNEEICVYVARFFNNYSVALCPGATGRQIAIGPKALNDRLRPLYDALGLDIPCGFANRFCIGAAALTWGARTCDPDHILCEQDFVSWAPTNSTPPIPSTTGIWNKRRARLHK